MRYTTYRLKAPVHKGGRDEHLVPGLRRGFEVEGIGLPREAALRRGGAPSYLLRGNMDASLKEMMEMALCYCKGTVSGTRCPCQCPGCQTNNGCKHDAKQPHMHCSVCRPNQ